jgi:hypothetical protein
VSDVDPELDAPPVDPRRAPLTDANRRLLFAIVAVAALLRIAWFVATKREPPQGPFQGGDQFSYYHYGREIALGKGYINYLTGEATAYYPIGFPALLGMVYFVALRTPVSDDLMLATGIVQIVASVGLVVATFVIGRRLLGVHAGLLAAGVIALWPNLIFNVSAVQIETTFTFLAAVALAVIVDHDWRTGPPTRNRLLVFGVALTVSAYIRPFSVWLLVGLLAALIIVRTGWRSVALGMAVPVVVLVLAFTPWTIRNAVRFDTFVPSSTNMGDTLCLDRSLDAQGGYRWSIHEGCADPTLHEAVRNRESTKLVLEFLREHPGLEMILIGRRARITFASDADWVEALDQLGPEPAYTPDERARLVDLSNTYFRVVLWLSIPGLVLAGIRTRRPERWLAGSMFFGLLGVILLLYGNPRFHVPLAPFGAIGAAAAVLTLANLVAGAARGIRSRRLLAPGEPVASTPESL